MSNFNDYELQRSKEFSKIISTLSKSENILHFVHGKTTATRIIVAFGSFDPLTIAHTTIFELAMEKQPDAQLVIISSINHMDKKLDISTNAWLPDRFLMLEKYAQGKNVALAFANTPYFVELINPLKQQYGKDVAISFVLGAELFEKLIDKRYYNDDDEERAHAISTLFTCTFLVANRFAQYSAEDTLRRVDAKTVMKENPFLIPYASRITPLETNDLIEKVSATQVRRSHAQGKSLSELEAEEVREFIERNHLYKNNTDYKSSVNSRRE